eukprot:CAMPEP_0117581562 /NCGR_PEP_ID=MMETSP0784-20121206/65902_1 /TAXON_ID=39447 /ORGANISM="" /LENGTH=31 /DNA_ID= /DNA_START= /DNA_END= /DNA_ORIENTATION=
MASAACGPSTPNLRAFVAEPAVGAAEAEAGE